MAECGNILMPEDTTSDETIRGYKNDKSVKTFLISVSMEGDALLKQVSVL